MCIVDQQMNDELEVNLQKRSLGSIAAFATLALAEIAAAFGLWLALVSYLRRYRVEHNCFCIFKTTTFGKEVDILVGVLILAASAVFLYTGFQFRKSMSRSSRSLNWSSILLITGVMLLVILCFQCLVIGFDFLR